MRLFHALFKEAAAFRRNGIGIAVAAGDPCPACKGRGERNARSNGVGALGHPVLEMSNVLDAVLLTLLGSIERGVEEAELPLAAGEPGFFGA
ncbi:MAG TPA: hypothetical protein VGF88_03450 [Acidobacteriaceae bacterium]|jgi:hypothetical protein